MNIYFAILKPMVCSGIREGTERIRENRKQKELLECCSLLPRICPRIPPRSPRIIPRTRTSPSSIFPPIVPAGVDTPAFLHQLVGTWGGLLPPISEISKNGRLASGIIQVSPGPQALFSLLVRLLRANKTCHSHYGQQERGCGGSRPNRGYGPG